MLDTSALQTRNVADSSKPADLQSDLQDLLSINDPQKLAERLLSSPAYLNRIRIQLHEGTLPVQLQQLLWHYRFGKPPDKIELTGKDGGEIRTIRRVIVSAKSEESSE